jgi:HSP20 family molecular chaperone IbpA
MSLNSSLQNIMNDALFSAYPYAEYLPIGKDVFGAVQSRFSFPPMNVVQRENYIEATIEVPGVVPRDINIELKNGYIEVSAQKTVENNQENDTFHNFERRSGSFTRRFKVYNNSRDDDVKARCVNGVLTINVRKPQNEDRPPNRIPVSLD